ncbi:MAG: T9SS type A sorting domain-containing protein, partial [Lutimonas sp.]
VLPVEEFELPERDLVVYPNPAADSFRINRNVRSVEVFDYTGRLVSRFEGDFFPDHNYDTSLLKPSMYILRIRTEQGSISQRLIVE